MIRVLQADQHHLNPDIAGGTIASPEGGPKGKAALIRA
jgi:hypothetical protein